MHSLPKLRYSSKSTLMGLLMLFVFSSTLLLAQEQIGRPIINNYTYQDYKAGPINWWATEDDEGIMYFANGSGVLQYDGVNWELTKLDNGARCLVKDSDGTIYVGSEGEIGYLKRDAIGKLQYSSLLDKIPEEHRVISTVWEVDKFKDRIIFRTEFKLFAWDGESMTVITSEEGYHVGKIVNGKYYLRIWGRGLCELKDDDTFEVVPNGEQFADIRIYSLLAYDET